MSDRIPTKNGGHDTESFKISNFTLQCGVTLPELVLVYQTYGQLSAKRDNAVLMPTWCSSNHTHNRWLIGPGRALDPRRRFIVNVNLLGNGFSSSPSNTPPPFDRRRFPPVTALDNVRAQQALLQELGIEEIALIAGRSMGAQTAFQWGSYFPEQVRAILAMCGSARTTPHNYVFLEGVTNALKLDPQWKHGEYEAPPKAGLRAVGRIYAGWAMSQEFYRAGFHLKEVPAATSLEDYLIARWDSNFSRCDVNDLLSQFETWQRFDVADNARYDRSFEAALAAVKARTIVMPCRTDMYFPPEDSAAAVSRMTNAELRVLESVWGHRAGAPGSPQADIDFVEAAISELLCM